MGKEEKIAAGIILLCLIAMFMGVYLIITQREREGIMDMPTRLGIGLKELSSKERIVVVRIYGLIQISDERGAFFLHGADRIVKRLKNIKKDPRVKGIILRIDSPGGSVAATQEIYKAIKDLRDPDRPVVISMGDIATSGAYYVACSADKIVANPGTLTGNIGVIMSIPNVGELLGRFGVKFTVIKSGRHKDIGSIFRDMSPEERNLLEGVINNAYDQFFKAFAEGRGGVIPEERLHELADGRIFTGEQAKELGLVDELGGLAEAVKLTAELAGIKGEPLVVEEDSFIFERFMGLLEERLLRNPLDELQKQERVRLEYRYLSEAVLNQVLK